MPRTETTIQNNTVEQSKKHRQITSRMQNRDERVRHPFTVATIFVRQPINRWSTNADLFSPSDILGTCIVCMLEICMKDRRLSVCAQRLQGCVSGSCSLMPPYFCRYRGFMREARANSAPLCAQINHTHTPFKQRKHSRLQIHNPAKRKDTIWSETRLGDKLEKKKWSDGL